MFWDMVSLDAEVETTGQEDEESQTILTITIIARTVDEMREFYSFTDQQNNMLDELLEARFFDEKQEVRLFRREGVLCAARLVCEEGDSWIDKTYEVENKDLGEQVTVRHFLAFDEDGQCYISTSCLTGWKGRKEGQNNG